MAKIPRALPLAALVVLLGAALTACSNEDADEDREASTTACRVIELADAALTGTREATLRDGVTPELAAGYTLAISTVTGAATEEEVSAEVADATVRLVSQWSRTRSYVETDLLEDSDDPETYGKRFVADQEALEAVLAACPGGSDDSDDSDD